MSEEKIILRKADHKTELCDDCKQTYNVPFDVGDGKVRCAGCAAHYYMGTDDNKFEAMISLPSK